MTKTVSCILIDPYTHEVSRVEREQSLQSIYDTLSNEQRKVRTIDALRIDSYHSLYLDDEAMLFEGIPTFVFSSNPHIKLAGRAMIVGTTPDGDDADVRTTPEIVKEAITFLDLVSTGHIGPIAESKNEDGFVVIGGVPVLKDKDS